MIHGILYGTITYCAIKISEIIISDKITKSKIEGKMSERLIYESKPSPINPTIPIEKDNSDSYEIEEI